MMVVQLNILQNSVFFTLKGCILLYVNYIAIKLLHKKSSPKSSHFQFLFISMRIVISKIDMGFIFTALFKCGIFSVFYNVHLALIYPFMLPACSLYIFEFVTLNLCSQIFLLFFLLLFFLKKNVFNIFYSLNANYCFHILYHILSFSNIILL